MEAFLIGWTLPLSGTAIVCLPPTVWGFSFTARRHGWIKMTTGEFWWKTVGAIVLYGSLIKFLVAPLVRHELSALLDLGMTDGVADWLMAFSLSAFLAAYFVGVYAYERRRFPT